MTLIFKYRDGRRDTIEVYKDRKLIYSIVRWEVLKLIFSNRDLCIKIWECIKDKKNKELEKEKKKFE